MVVVPVVPVLSAPANVATSITVSPTLSWGTVSGAVTYGVQLSTTSAFTSTVVNDSTLAAGTKAVSGLLNSSQYFWRVNAKNSAGTSAWSPVWSFTTSATTAYKTKYAFIYVVDGSRFVETFGDTIGAGVSTTSHHESRLAGRVLPSPAC